MKNLYIQRKDLQSNIPFMLEKMNKRNKKMVYKRSKDTILESPPLIYNINHYDYHGNESVGFGYDQNERYFMGVRGNGHYQQYYDPVYYNLHPSYLQHYKKYYKDKNLQYYAPLYGISRIGT